MKLNKITEWIKKQITRHKNNSGQIDRDPEQQEEAKKKIKIDYTVSSYNASIDEIAKALEKLRKAGYTIGEKTEPPKQHMSNNRRKMKGIPIIRWQQLRRAQRNRRKKTNGWQQLREKILERNQEENAQSTAQGASRSPCVKE